MPIHIYFELMSLLASITLYFQKGTPRYMKYFPVFLLVTVVVEITGWNMADREISLWIYNFFVIIGFEFYLFILRAVIHSKRGKKLISLFLVGYPILALTNIFFVQTNEFHSMTFALGCLLVVVGCIYYFLELFRRPDTIDLVREHAFWITSGLLFFHSCTFALFSLLNFLFKGSTTVMRNTDAVLKVILFLFYLLFTIAFLCRIKFRKQS